jgi:hypothetical protein
MNTLATPPNPTQTESWPFARGERAPDIGRLLAALRGEKPAGRIPNFEITIEPRNLEAILGRKAEAGMWGLPPQTQMEVARRTGMDAIPCPIQFHLPQASVHTMEDFRRLAAQPDLGPKLAKFEASLAASKGSGVGVCPCVTGPMTAAYLAAGPIAIQSFMLLIHDEPELVEALMDFYLEYDLRLVAAIRDLPFAFWYLGDDVTGMVGRAHLERLWKPRQERIVRAMQESGKPILMHCCGPVGEILPWVDEWGVEALHPIQPVVNDIAQVRRDHPGLTLVGNLDINLLSSGSAAQVREKAEALIETLAAGGRYVLCSSHSIIDSVKPENFRAMTECAWAS